MRTTKKLIIETIKKCYDIDVIDISCGPKNPDMLKCWSFLTVCGREILLYSDRLGDMDCYRWAKYFHTGYKADDLNANVSPDSIDGITFLRENLNYSHEKVDDGWRYFKIVDDNKFYISQKDFDRSLKLTRTIFALERACGKPIASVKDGVVYRRGKSISPNNVEPHAHCKSDGFYMLVEGVDRIEGKDIIYLNPLKEEMVSVKSLVASGIISL